MAEADLDDNAGDGAESSSPLTGDPATTSGKPDRSVEGKRIVDSSKASPENPKDEFPRKLSPEEQMALYEKELKENDWGHQPC